MGRSIRLGRVVVRGVDRADWERVEGGVEVGRDLVRSGGSEGGVEGGQWRRRGRRLVGVDGVEMCLVVVGWKHMGRGRGRGGLIQRVVQEYRDGNWWRCRSHQVEGRLGVT